MKRHTNDTAQQLRCEQFSIPWSHYHGERYTLAANAFRSSPSSKKSEPSDSPDKKNAGNRKRKRSISYSSGLFASISHLSVEADIHLCRARSGICSETGRSANPNVTVSSLVKSAIDANVSFQEALFDSFLSFRRRSIIEKTTLGRDPKIHFTKMQISASFMMSGVSLAWLYLQMGCVSSASLAATKAIKSAALCLDYSLKGSQEDDLGSLFVTDEEAIRHVFRCVKTSERATLAASTLFQTFKVIHLAKSCQQPHQETNSNMPIVDDKYSSFDNQLAAQQLITKAMIIHTDPTWIGTNQDHDRTTTRDAIIDEAIAVQPSSRLAHKLRNLFQGMHALHNNNNSTCETDILAKLEELSTTSREAANLKACLYASRNKQYSKALDGFQEALEFDQKNQTEFGHPHVETITNLSLCFASMGHAEPAQELLLHVLTLNNKPNHDNNDNTANQKPAFLFVSKDGAILLNQNSQDPISSTVTRLGLLWRLFNASSYANDWPTCIAATDELCDNSMTNNKRVAQCAHIFSLLQNYRPTLSLELGQEFMMTGINRHPLLSIAVLLYQADALVTTEQGFNDDLVDDFIADTESTTTVSCANSRGIDSVYSATQQALDFFNQLPPPHLHNCKKWKNYNIMEAIIKNDCGIALIMAGKPLQAMTYLQEAATATTRVVQRNGTSSTTSGSFQSQLLSERNTFFILQPHFNLSLLLYREGHILEATKVWFCARGLGEYASQWLDQESTTDCLKEKLEEAITRHELFYANKYANKKEFSNSSNASHQEHVPHWKNDSEEKGRIGGLDKIQLYALDVSLLKCAVDLGRRKKAVSYKKKSGGLLEGLNR